MAHNVNRQQANAHYAGPNKVMSNLKKVVTTKPVTA